MTHDSKSISDGYHTFGELYAHRYQLFLALCAALTCLPVPCQPWRSVLHADGTMFDDSFIMGVTLPTGQLITYHLPLRHWELTNFAETCEMAPPWDGHTSDDVLQALASYCMEFNTTQIGSVK